MRHARAAATLVFILVVAGSAAAQSAADLRIVKVAQAEVRARPSTNPQFYVTNRLPRGTIVEVLKELPDGWLEVRPPPGSVSWINMRFLERIDPKQPNYVVVALEGATVPVFVGSEVESPTHPTISGAKLTRGTQVTPSGGRINTEPDGNRWMCIEPPPSEVRYLRADTVERTSSTAGNTVSTVSATAGPPGAPAGPLPGSSAPSANPPPTPAQLWQQAQQAERSGKTAEAIRLYARTAAEAGSSNPRLASDALARANYLQNGYREYGAVPSPAPAPAGPAPAATVPSAAPVRLGAPTDIGRGSPASAASTFVPRDPQTGMIATTVSTGRLSNAPPAGYVGFRGRLVRTGRSLGEPTYRLESVQAGISVPVTYVVAARGVNLEAYVGRLVEVWAVGRYDGDLRANVVRVVRVFPM